VLVLVGIGAGVLTTVVGLGGGALLVAGLAAVWHDPVRALAVTTPALLAGNLHRAWWYRGEVPVAAVRAFAGAAFAGAFLGGALALAVPSWLVTTALAVGGGLVLLRATGHLALTVRPAWLPAAGAGVGVLSTAGGGLLAGPLLVAAGWSGGAYVGAVAVTAASMHLGRLLALSAGGATSMDTWRDAVALGLAIPVGNVLGAHLRGRVPTGWQQHLEVAGALAVVGAALLA
jgi:uncharacterized membrane protein YfcA